MRTYDDRRPTLVKAVVDWLLPRNIGRSLHLQGHLTVSTELGNRFETPSKRKERETL
ncbi:predicted protein [Sclerotinia sclerotiorum 1980 UF-70]|uniref:Uncharacterized protein n=1 Tax=Sclerotinia sclerotiorum (strain ATCC 18683 / 1980 / Ss-1) TaxID=665079 RepID=A7EJ34_SCLS1|nr:predicted protein [Sclerotinia sclerotiorum 1980 UF-70]EDO02850.1 predicted protein [Sclerotinia sclerotiorum 1980 UF-70]